jgi:hypothetical protein
MRGRQFRSMSRRLKRLEHQANVHAGEKMHFTVSFINHQGMESSTLEITTEAFTRANAAAVRRPRLSLPRQRS